MEDFAMDFEDQIFDNNDGLFDDMEDLDFEDLKDELDAIEKYDLDIDEEI
ncbi:hypothetical protein KMW28_28015 [Flammeovirga yaeyamensis]|uniref:Uncharacterized protein n=1 Tax=Flammeovirga yaeyamensis TaxID=367791 RepID=A0AAX1NF99_9BACT|nr:MULTISPECIES: hypothetical protein [Flammeovirga]ANQ52443.1 hypothetical protein MY04_5108 [Flammeovirga sp. MY04]MBB3699866.1 hypothetical protein [Flammeovirga yaeyamensis]NMF38337.1 hypothetical protein [Flammeovirga yaeyamensis]QWG04748.1 hypothetical protein KMW28_28015 [Flammeovirga yaeyamensis]